MVVYAIVRVTKSSREWMRFYGTSESAQRQCDAMNANLSKRTTPYEVVPITVED